MSNPWRGEVSLKINGEPRVLRLTLGSLAELEEMLDGKPVVEIVENLEAGRFSARDVLAVIVAGLRGGGWDVGGQDLAAAEIGDGPFDAARAAAELIARAFSLPEEQ